MSLALPASSMLSGNSASMGDSPPSLRAKREGCQARRGSFGGALKPKEDRFCSVKNFAMLAK